MNARSFFLPVLCLIFVSTLSGCWPLRKRLEQSRKRALELEQAPFAMPEEFPVPEDAVAVTRPLKGDTLIFETYQTLRQLETFYDKLLLAAGLRKAEFGAHFPGGFQISFEGWPNGCILSVGAVDLAYSSAVDKRTVSGKLDGCRR